MKILHENLEPYSYPVPDNGIVKLVCVYQQDLTAT